MAAIVVRQQGTSGQRSSIRHVRPYKRGGMTALEVKVSTYHWDDDLLIISVLDYHFHEDSRLRA